MLIGQTNFRGEQRRFHILPEDRLRHLYLIGKTGVGKSTLLENMAIQDIEEGNGILFLDPHGESAEKLLRFVPANRTNDVIYFDPSDTEYPVSFNPMDEGDIHLVSSGMIEVFKKIWGDSWGAQLEHILRHTLIALLEVKPSTLLGVQRVLIDEAYRSRITQKIKDPVVRQFWGKEWPERIMKRRDDPLASILNKVGQFLTVPLMRNILSQPKTSFNLREAMDERKIIILNLSKGKIGEDNMSLLGSLFITKLKISAMSRSDSDSRVPFYAYIDEFQNFSTPSFAQILSEARKYGLSLTLANQYTQQLPQEIRDAVFGNCGTLISFRVGAEDAKILSVQMPPFKPDDFINLPRYQFYISLCINGTTSDAFSAGTLPPKTGKGSPDKIKKTSRERYAKKRAIIEQKLIKILCG